MADDAVKKVAKDTSKMWIGGLSLVVVILLVVNFYYMKKLRDAKKTATDNGGMGGGELGDKPADASTAKINTSTKEVLDTTNVPK